MAAYIAHDQSIDTAGIDTLDVFLPVEAIRRVPDPLFVRKDGFFMFDLS